MSNRFEHLKKKKFSGNLSRDNFIDNAENLKANDLKPKEEALLLITSGKMNINECGKKTLIYLKNDIEKDIGRYCIGSKVSVVNFLIRKGLDSLLEKKERIVFYEDE